MQRLRSLTVAPTCTFSYVALRASYATILQMDKSVFGSEPCTLLLYCFQNIFQNSSTLIIENSWFESVRFWTTRYTFEHSYLLSTTHSSPSCLSCGHTLRLLPFFRYKTIIRNQKNISICGGHILKQSISHAFLRRMPSSDTQYRAYSKTPTHTIILHSRSRILGKVLIVLIFWWADSQWLSVAALPLVETALYLLLGLSEDPKSARVITITQCSTLCQAKLI